MSEGIPDFLRARYAEERVEAGKQLGDDYPLDSWAIRWEETGEWNSYSYLRITKARLLADLTSKVRIIEALFTEGHASVAPGGSTEIYCDADYDQGGICSCGRDERVERCLRLLALPYADHPEYREEWRP